MTFNSGITKTDYEAIEFIYLPCARPDGLLMCFMESELETTDEHTGRQEGQMYKTFVRHAQSQNA